MAVCLAALALDYRCMSTALGSINGEIAAGRWDLLRLTLADRPQIVAAKHGAAQVRVWRLMTLIVALRARGRADDGCVSYHDHAGSQRLA